MTVQHPATRVGLETSSSVDEAARVLTKCLEVLSAPVGPLPRSDAASWPSRESLPVPDSVRDLVAAIGEVLEQLARPSGSLRPSCPPRATELTAREREVLGALARGRTNKQIAGELDLRPKTVMHHCAAIFRKLEVTTRSEATATALRHELVDLVSQR